MSTSAALAAAAFPEHTAPLAGGVPLTSGQAIYPDANGRLTGDATTLNVKGKGAKGDGATDDSAAIQAAIDAVVAAGGGIVSFPAGTYIAGTMIDWANATGIYLVGAGSGATIIKLKNGANVDLLGMSTFAAKVAANLGDGPHDFGVRGITIDGNRANNATGYGIRIYGYNFTFDDVVVRNCAQDGAYTTWTTVNDGIILTSTSNSLESLVIDCKFHHNGGWGYNFNGPHDTRFVETIYELNNQSGGVAGGLYTGASGQASACHVWGTTHYYGEYAVAPFVHTNCEWEGAAQACLAIAANGQVIAGGDIYNSSRAGLELLNNAALINAQLSFNNVISGNAILFTSDGGNNLILAQMYQTAGAMVGGTKAATTTLIAQTGGGAVAPGSSVAGPLLLGNGAGAASYSIAGTGAVTASGNEITDATRTTATQGDGRATPDSSYGIWDAATNLVANGGAETNATGATDHSSTTTRVTAEHKFGTASYQVVTGNATANEGPSWAISGGAAATQYSVSAWVKGNAGGTVRIALSDSVSGKQASSPVTLTGTWQRITKTATTGAASSTQAVYVETDVQQAVTFFVDGVQAEAFPIATPYVETNGGTATRAVASVALPGGLLNPVQGWVAIAVRTEFAASGTLPNASPRAWELGADTTDRLFLAAVANSWTLQRNSSVQQPSDSYAVGTLRVLIAKWDATTHSLSVAGVSFAGHVTSGDSGYSTTKTYTLGVGYAPSIANRDFNGEIFWIAGGIGTLTDADAATLNAIGTTDPTIPQLLALNGGAANPTFLWTCATGTYNTLDPVFGQSSHRPSVQLGTATTAAAGANAGTSPPATVTQNCTDEKGTITFGTGGSAAAGAQVVVTFGSSYGVTPAVTVAAGNDATQQLGLYVSSKTATGFTLSTHGAPASTQANTVYSFDYVVRG